MFKVGDTIKCLNQTDMINTSMDLDRHGVMTDWLNIKEQSDRKWTLTVVGIEEDKP